MQPELATMCELFCMSTRRPTTVRFSLEAFSRRGGLDGPHKDGWGIAYYDDDDADVHLMKEAHPASGSACVRFVQEHPFESRLVVSHIRRATQGGVSSANCQPFVRELGGRMHVFAHNGNLDADRLPAALPYDTFAPVGTTDSERAFCALLSRLRALEKPGARAPWQQRLAVFSDFAADARALGPANLIYADGEWVFAHADRRTQKDGTIAPPGLHVLQRHCASDSPGIETEGLTLRASGEQHVVLVASVPLTNEPGWRPLPAGSIVAARAGEIVVAP
jgi:predicted glutamine amidotransferase